MEVYKIQRSLADSEGGDMILIYNEDRSFLEQFSVDNNPGGKKFFDKLMQGEPKIYVKGNFTDKGVIEVHGIIDNPGW